MYLPHSPQGICMAIRADTLCIYQTPCPEIHGRSLNRHIRANTGLSVPKKHRQKNAAEKTETADSEHADDQQQKRRKIGKGSFVRDGFGDMEFWNHENTPPKNTRENPPPNLRARPPGIEWKTGRNPKMGKNWPKKRKWPSARNGERMAQKCRKN